MKVPLNLYFVALVPPEPIYTEVVDYKRHIHAEYESKAALRSPPHITLHMPFKWSGERDSEIKTVLDQLALGHSKFDITLNNFGCFEPRVIYLNVAHSNELITLQQEIMNAAALNWKIFPLPRSRAFHPHLTIAFRDLKKPAFYTAWQEYQTKRYYATFSVEHIALLKHNGKTWDIQHESLFGD